MYEYEYVPVVVRGKTRNVDLDFAHRKVIDERASAGWRYVGFVPSDFNGRGGISEVDLIFERERSAEQ